MIKDFNYEDGFYITTKDVVVDADIYGPITITKGVKIEAGVKIQAGCCIGGEPESRKEKGKFHVSIGQGTIIHSGASIDRGFMRTTSIGKNCLIMHGAHIAHDCVVGDDVTLSHNVVLAGHVTVMRNANIGISAGVHQWCTIGSYCMVGMHSAVIHDLPPFFKAFGVPARIHQQNEYLAKNFKAQAKQIEFEEFMLLRGKTKRHMMDIPEHSDYRYH